jgi:hypothetical protein
MKRCIGIMALVCAAAISLAQAPFNIVRPADGSRVRETVRILLPQNSIPSGGYIGVFVNKKFIEATIPTLKDNFYEYELDTKARQIADGTMEIEVVLFVDFNERPRIVDRSSIQVTVANQSSIPIPAEGIALRYRFQPQTEMVYTMQQRVYMQTLSEAQNQLGGRPAEIPVGDSEVIRLLYAVDNAYPNGDGLVRIQALPTRGKDFAMLTTSGETEPKKYFDYQMHPVYMRLASTGREVWGSVPFYVPLEGSGGESARTDLFALFPLPTLPTRNVRPGDAWQSRFQGPNLDLDRLHTLESLTETMPARGEFVGVEWEMGRPCAKIRHVIEQGVVSREGQNLSNAGRAFGDDRIKIEETIWFALDRGVVIKAMRTTTMDQRMANEGGVNFGSGGGAPSGGRGGSDMGGSGAFDRFMDRLRQGGPRGAGGGPSAPGLAGSAGGPGGPAGPASAGAGFGQGNRGGAPAGGQHVRLRIEQIFTLEG